MPEKKVDLTKQLKAILDQYGEEIKEDLQTALGDTAKATVAELHNKSPKLTGKYRKGWKADTQTDRLGTVHTVVYNADYPFLTGLLNDGHDYVGRDGHRIEKAAKGDGHIDKASEYAEGILMTEVEKRLSND